MKIPRIAIFGITFVTLVLAYDYVGQKIDTTPRDNAGFWLNKVTAQPAYDVILAGDSRVLRGLAPEIMSPAMNGAKVTNYGFGGVGYDEPYLNSLDKLSSKQSCVIVLGLSPRTLNEIAPKTSQYLVWSRTDYVERLCLRALHSLNVALKPQNPLLLVKIKLYGNGPRWWQEYHEDGWLPGDRIPNDPLLSLKTYEDIYKSNAYSLRLEHLLLKHIQSWCKNGKRVVCFRPPTTDRMVALENQSSGFNEQRVVQLLKGSGAIWFEVAQNMYPTFDGNHLTKQGAIQFSKDFSRLLVANGIVRK